MIKQLVPKENFVPTYEIDIEVRDSQGNPTGRRKTFSSDRASDIADFYYRHQVPKKRKKKEVVPDAAEAAKILSGDEELQKLYQQNPNNQEDEGANGETGSN